MWSNGIEKGKSFSFKFSNTCDSARASPLPASTLTWTSKQQRESLRTVTLH